MKTSKGFDKQIGKVNLMAIFTLHHFSIGIYWAAPSIAGHRRISITLHLPFFIGGVCWNAYEFV